LRFWQRLAPADTRNSHGVAPEGVYITKQFSLVVAHGTTGLINCRALLAIIGSKVAVRVNFGRREGEAP
jgi:hypothetical protein